MKKETEKIFDPDTEISMS